MALGSQERVRTRDLQSIGHKLASIQVNTALSRSALSLLHLISAKTLEHVKLGPPGRVPPAGEKVCPWACGQITQWKAERGRSVGRRVIVR